jgi:hypothetical protein
MFTPIAFSVGSRRWRAIMDATREGEHAKSCGVQNAAENWSMQLAERYRASESRERSCGVSEEGLQVIDVPVPSQRCAPSPVGI